MVIRKIITLSVISTVLFTGIQTLAIEDEADLFRPVDVHNGSVLNIIDCVSLAFKNSPKIRREKYNLDVAKSNVGIAKSQYFPVISAGAGFYNENNSNSIYYDSHYRDLPSVGVSINQLIWNFGKTTAYIKMEEFYKIGAEYEFMDSLCNTLFDVKAKYYNLLKAKALLNVAKNNEDLNQRIVNLTKGRDKADITTAKVNLSEAKIKYIEAENTFNNAKVDLTNSMYLDSQYDYDIENTPTFTYNDDYGYDSKLVEAKPFEPYVFPFEKSEAVDIAYKNSPDLRVLIAVKKAMEQSLKYVKRTYLPDLIGTVGYSYGNIKSNTEERVSNNSLYAGVKLSSDINIKELYHSIKGADAQLNMAENEIVLFKQDLFFELKRAFNNLEKSERRIKLAQEEAKKAFYTSKIIIDRYKQGSVDYTALQDARTDFIEAENDYINSLYDYNMALIQVEMAMHVHIADIHHKSEHAMRYHANELLEHLNKALACDEKEAEKNSNKELEEDL